MPHRISLNLASPSFKVVSSKTKSDKLKFETDDKLLEYVSAAVFNLIPSFNKCLSQRPHSHFEVKMYLISKFDKLKISVSDKVFFDKLVEKLVEEKVLNDEAKLIRFWLISRSESTPRSLFGIKYELKQKRVDPQIIDRVIQDLINKGEYSELKALKNLYQRYKSKPWLKFKQAALRHRFKFEAIKQLKKDLHL